MSEETALVVAHERSAEIQLGTLQASGAAELTKRASEVATSLRDVIEKQRLSVNIQGRKFVRCEGWTTLGTMLGVLPREVSVERADDGTYTAVVELVRMNDGAVMSRASAECGADESTWRNRPNYARRSMAVTRATGKACRLAFSWVMVMSGYEPTPAEEMPPEPDAGPRSIPQDAPSSAPVVEKKGGVSIVKGWTRFQDAGLLTLVPVGKNAGKPIDTLSRDEMAASLDGTIALSENEKMPAEVRAAAAAYRTALEHRITVSARTPTTIEDAEVIP